MRIHAFWERLSFLTLSLTVGSAAFAQTTTLDSVTAKVPAAKSKPAAKTAPGRVKEPILPLPEKKLSAVNADNAKAIRPATLQKTSAPAEAVAPIELSPPAEVVKVEPVKEAKIAPTSAAIAGAQASAATDGKNSSAQSSSAALASNESALAASESQAWASSNSAQAKSSAQAEVVQAAPVVVVAPTPVIFTSDSNKPTWLNFELSFVYSQWQKLSPGMAKGSLKYGLSVSRDVLPNLEAGLGIRSIRGGATNGSNNDIRSAEALTLSGRYLFTPGKFTPYAGATLSLGQYKAWKTLNETSSQITYGKQAGGILVGISPTFGMTARLTEETRLTLGVEYDYYFGKSAKHVGGVGVASSVGVAF